MARQSYRSYVLVAKKENEFIEIDWTKIEAFHHFQKEKYKLEKIDFFTRHYIDQNDLINALLKMNLLSLEQLKNIRLWIYPAKQNTKLEMINGRKRRVSSPLYAPSHLPYGLAYQKHTPLYDDFYIIHLLQSKLKDWDFISKLYNKYAKEGDYSERNYQSLETKINSTKQAMSSSSREEQERYERILKSYYHQYYAIKEMNSLLNSVRRYTLDVNSSLLPSHEQQESVRNNIKEFFLRLKYVVVSCRDGINDNRTLEFKLDANQKRTVNYLAFHEFFLFLQKCLEEEKPKQEETPKILKKKKEVDGQISLLDFL